MFRYSAMAIISAAAFYGEVEASEPQGNVKIYKVQGSRQCEGGGQSLEALKRQLVETGAKVLVASCGVDGKMYPAVCGAADGRIGIFEIPASKAQSGLPEGFFLLSSLPDAQIVPCK